MLGHGVKPCSVNSDWERTLKEQSVLQTPVCINGTVSGKIGEIYIRIGCENDLIHCLVQYAELLKGVSPTCSGKSFVSHINNGECPIFNPVFHWASFLHLIWDIFGGPTKVKEWVLPASAVTLKVMVCMQ